MDQGKKKRPRFGRKVRIGEVLNPDELAILDRKCTQEPTKSGRPRYEWRLGPVLVELEPTRNEEAKRDDYQATLTMWENDSASVDGGGIVLIEYRPTAALAARWAERKLSGLRNALNGVS